MKFSCLSLRTLTVLTLSGSALWAHAQPAASDAIAHEASLKERAQQRLQLRQEIAQERQHIQLRKADAEKACWQRFAVEDCLRDVRAQAHAQDNVLRKRELDINNEERQEKAAERLRAIEQKQREKKASGPVTTNVRGATEQAATVRLPAHIGQAEADRAQAAKARAAQTDARVAKQQAEMAAHEKADAERRAKAQQRLQEKQEAAQARRAAKADAMEKRKGAPLPIPEGLPQP